MPRMWQYQILAELPPADKLAGDWDERTDPGKWAPKLPDIQFQARYLSKAIHPDISTAPIVTFWEERIRPDKWWPVLPDIYFRKMFLSRAIYPSLGAAPPAELIMLDKWMPILPARHYEKAYLLTAIMPYRAHTDKPWYEGDAALNFIYEKTRTRF